MPILFLLHPERIFYQDPWVLGIWDAFPVNPGHALLITKRHVRDWFEASPQERTALTRAVDVARFAIAGSFQADVYNIGINVGEAAGQTVFHLHLHVIPRVRGDVEDPRAVAFAMSFPTQQPIRFPVERRGTPQLWLPVESTMGKPMPKAQFFSYPRQAPWAGTHLRDPPTTSALFPDSPHPAANRGGSLPHALEAKLERSSFLAGTRLELSSGVGPSRARETPQESDHT